MIEHLLGQVHVDECSRFMRSTMPADCVDLIVTSPPYDYMRDYHGYGAFDVEAIGAAALRVVKPGGVMVWIAGDKRAGGMRLKTFEAALMLRDVGWHVQDVMIWHKSNPMCGNFGKRYTPAHEIMLILSNGAVSTFHGLRAAKVTHDKPRMKQNSRDRAGNKMPYVFRQAKSDDKLRDNVWVLPKAHQRDLPPTGDHPAVMPVHLAADHVLSWSNSGDVVFDPMAGSGVTLYAAAQNGRRWLGCDISAEYAEVARRRLAEHAS